MLKDTLNILANMCINTFNKGKINQKNKCMSLSVEMALSRLANVAIPAYVRFKYGGCTSEFLSE